MAPKEKQDHSPESQCWKKMRRLKFRLRTASSVKNNNSHPESPGVPPSPSPIMSPGGLSSMRVTVTEVDKPSPQWRNRKKILRFGQFLEVRMMFKSI